MPTRLFLIRHADSVHKVEGITGGTLSCRGLTELGRWQTEQLRDRLRRISCLPDHIYASVIPRAVETAQILAAGLGKSASEIRQNCDFCSWHIPAEVDGMTWKEHEQRFSVVGGGVFRPFQSVSESWSELVSRTGRGLWGIAQQHQGKTLLVVVHRETIVASLTAFGNLPLRPDFEVNVSNASLTEWTTDEDTTAFPPVRWTLARFNDSAHLEESFRTEN